MRRTKAVAMRQAATDTRVSICVRSVEVEARRLLTVDEHADVWRGGPMPAGVDGAIVRLVPPDEVGVDAAQAVRAGMLAAGAVAVKVLPKVRGVKVLPKVRDVAPVAAARDVVAQLVEEARCDDREALRRECELLLAQAGI